MKRAIFGSIVLVLLSFLVPGTSARPPSLGSARGRLIMAAMPRVDAREALRRARLEQDLIQAEKTAVLLGELVIQRQEAPR